MNPSTPQKWLVLTVAVLLSACSAEKIAPVAEQDALAGYIQDVDASNHRAFQLEDLERIQEAMPEIEAQARTELKKKKANKACPTGLNEECLNAVLLSLGNTPVLKYTTVGLEAGLSVLKNGNSMMEWKARVTQPYYGAGYTLAFSKFNQPPTSLPIPLSGAAGYLGLVSQAPAAAIGGFVALTDGSNFAGIIGGFAGISPRGYITGAFGCGFKSTIYDGVPAAECFTIPLSAVGW